MVIRRRHFVPIIKRQIEEFGNSTECAEIVSAIPLNPRQKCQIEDLIADITKKRVTTTFRVERQILGGLVVRVGDKIIDGSLRTRLEALRREVEKNI